VEYCSLNWKRRSFASIIARGYLMLRRDLGLDEIECGLSWEPELFWVLYIYFLFYDKYKLREISMLTSSNFQLFLSNYVTFDGCPRTFELFPVICCLED
jgi:hypothetical protein